MVRDSMGKKDNNKADYSIIGCPFGFGGRVPGAKEAPAVLRRRGLLEQLTSVGVSIQDLGDIEFQISQAERKQLLTKLEQDEAKIENIIEVFGVCRALAAMIEKALETGSKPIVLGGDHSLSLGSVAGVSNYFRKKGESLGLIWIDTHADINTPKTSLSGCLHGMPVSCLIGEYQSKLFSGLQQDAPAIAPENMVYVGLRDLDSAEREIIRKRSLRAYSMKDIDLRGVGPVISEAIELASKGTAGFIVSFDLDVCDPRIVPGTGTPKRGGLTFRESHLIWELLSESGGVRSIELVELNPILDKDFQTADLAIALLESAVGKTIL